MGFSHQGNQVFYDGKRIFTTPSEIWKNLVEIAPDRVAVIYNSRKLAPDGGMSVHPEPLQDEAIKTLVNRNVFLIDRTGRVLWRIETMDDEPSMYSQVRKNAEGEWITYQLEGWEYKLDINTGKVSQPVFTK